LAEFLFLHAVAGFAGFFDVDGFRVDVHVALRRNHVAAGLLVGVASDQRDVALSGTDG